MEIDRPDEYRKASVGNMMIKVTAKPSYVSTRKSVKKVNETYKMSVVHATY